MKRTIPEGLTPEYMHLRNYDDNGNLLAKGGQTTVTLLDEDGKPVVLGYTEPQQNQKKGAPILSVTATCYYKDNFCKAMGRTVALGLALATLDGTKAERKQRKLDAERLAKRIPAEEIHDAAIYV
jgi:hypothetical protein